MMLLMQALDWRLSSKELMPDPESAELIEQLTIAIRQEVSRMLGATSQDREGLLTRKEAAHFLALSLPTLRLYTRTGRLKAYRIGRRILYRRSELLSCLEPLRYSRSGGDRFEPSVRNQ